MGKLLGKRVILHYHGGAARLFFKRWGIVAKFAAIMADKLVVPSEYLQEVFRDILRIGVVAIPNLVELDLFCFETRSVLFPYLLVTRHLEPEYDIACALKAFAIVRDSYPQAKLYVAGDGSERCRLEKLSRELGCSEAISFLGSIPNQEIIMLLKEADIYVNSSRVDNMPVSILEAFASGVPVVSTRAGGIPHMIKHGENGLLVGVGDHEALASAVIWLLEHQDEAQVIRSLAREYVEHCTWKQVKSMLFELYGCASGF